MEALKLMKIDSWGNNSVGKILKMQTWGHEFNSQHPHKKICGGSGL